MPYQCVATSVAGFVQQLAVNYVARGYYFYATGIIPERKDPAKTDGEKRARKQEVLGALTKSLGARRPITNATLAQHLAYRAGAGPGGFERVLAGCNQEWVCFFAALSKVQPGDFARPQQEQFDEVLARLRGTLR